MALLAAAVVGGGAVAAEVRCVVDGCVSCLIIIIKYTNIVYIVPLARKSRSCSHGKYSLSSF